MTVKYESNQDFYTNLCSSSAATVLLSRYLKRELSNRSDLHYRRLLHKCMGYKASTIEDSEY